MDPSTNGHTVAEQAKRNGHIGQSHDEAGDVIAPGWRWTLPRVVGASVFLGLAVFWIWVFANRGSIAHPDEFDDPAFAETAEAVCLPYQQRISELKNPTLVETPEERAVLLDQATAELTAMIDELETLSAPADPKGAAAFPRWIADYRIYLDDRTVWGAVLATGDDPPFVVSGNEDGVRVTNRLNTWAEVNLMESCAPSQDV